MPAESKRPTRRDLEAAYGRRVPDLVKADLALLFCGINPSLYSAAVGHHFARPGNRFWKTIFHAGFTERLLAPAEERHLLDRGIGITNIAPRATASADEIGAHELERGARTLARKVRRYRVACVAFLGIDAYRTAMRVPKARVGLQPVTLAGARVWALPNPSGLNAHYQLDALVTAYAELARDLGLTR
jgi:double-stranded uracil-DNA glycosylase